MDKVREEINQSNIQQKRDYEEQLHAKDLLLASMEQRQREIQEHYRR
jgi:hypothetical protein